MMTVERIVKQLESNVKMLKSVNLDLQTTSLNEGKLKYGSAAEFRKVKDTVLTQFQTLNAFLEWIEDNHTDIEDTPDIMDMGLNELSIGDE
jgi:hypothetical protein